LVAESVELATILLTDLVGSTRLATSVGPVRADQLREEHFELLRDAIDSSGGREVKNTGDGLMVAFSSASAAVHCAVGMQQLFERRYRDAEQALHLRVGLGAGESTVKDGDYFGLPSIEAARLCAEAPSDGILISGLTKTLAGRSDGIEFSSVGDLELKGFPDPVEAFSVSWAPLGEEVGEPSGRWPLPALLRSVPPVKYVGRVEERAALDEAMKLARGGAREVVLLSGEPGIGKTRLSSYAAHDAHAEGFAVCWGACSEELGVPYEPWIQVCSQIVEHAPHELLERHVRRHGGELGRVARNLAERVADLADPQSSDPETERYLLFSAIAGLLEEVALSIPLCLVLDDLHWADGQSVALLKHFVRTVDQAALHLIVTYRDSDLGKDHPLTGVLADLRSQQGVRRIALYGLPDEEVAELVTAAAAQELDEDGVQLAGEIAAETDGNPFFVEEILRSLLEAGAVAHDVASGRWIVDRSAMSLPQSIREVIERRVERMGDEAREVLILGAVIGREFDLRVLGAVASVDEAELLDRVERAVAASLLAESPEQVGRFRFVHALINHTLYEALGATRRARMHERVAHALEELHGADPGEHLAELALHWRLAAVSVNKGKAADYALRAGNRALENLAPAEAVKLFADAVELIGDVHGVERCEALIGLGEALRQSGDAAFRETLLEASGIALSLQDAELAARAVFANNRGFASILGEVDQERLAAIERALELDDPPQPARRARLLALQAQELLWDADYGRRWALADEAIPLAREATDLRTLPEVLTLAANAYWTSQTLDLRRGLTKELSECAAATGDPALLFWAHQIEFNFYGEKGELAQAQHALEGMMRISDELGQPILTWFAQYAEVCWELVHGELAPAETLVEAAFQTGQEAQAPDAIFVYGAQLAYIRHYQGRTAEIIEMLAQSVSAFPGVPAWRASLASFMCWIGRQGEATAILEEASRDRFEHILPGPDRSTALVLYADTAVETRNADVASILRDLIEPWADQVDWNPVVAYGHARMWLGLLAGVLGEHEEADRHLAFASEFNNVNHLPLWSARGHLGWAEALAGRGDAASAREHAATALELSRAYGYGLFEPRAAALVEAQSPAGA
jgi:class 3 adenylate cyclase